MKSINSALISVFHKEGLEPLVSLFKKHNTTIYSTGGTARYLSEMGLNVNEVAGLTGYPSILGGRVKTLHPKVHGGILARRDENSDLEELKKYDIPEIDLVMVDLYPFSETVKSGAGEEEVIEKIDIGGIALIRAAAKNFGDVTIIAHQNTYGQLTEILEAQDGKISLAQRRDFARQAFGVSSQYDTAIFDYFSGNTQPSVKLRYGENPHQDAWYEGDLSSQFEQLNGKALSYNNLVDIEGALQLTDEFEEPFFAVIKHTNPCGCAVGSSIFEAWQKALAGDPVSAFGGILSCNGTVNKDVAEDIRDKKLFFEVLIADDFEEVALEILKKSKNRILLKRKSKKSHNHISKTLLDGRLIQKKNNRVLQAEDIEVKSSRQPSSAELKDVYFGDKVVKHLKSNAIAIVKDGQLIGSGVGQTSRIDALRQAIQKAKHHGFELKGSTLSSDAFFPFGDAVEMAHAEGIEIIVEPGGSIRDNESIDFCESHKLCLIFTGIRHFKH